MRKIKEIQWEKLERGKLFLGYIKSYTLFIIRYNDIGYLKLSDKEIKEYGGVWLLQSKIPIEFKKSLFVSIEVAQLEANKLLKKFYNNISY
jgi:hypothetical protein